MQSGGQQKWLQLERDQGRQLRRFEDDCVADDQRGESFDSGNRERIIPRAR